MEGTENFQHALGYPECKNAKPIIEIVDVPCPVCGGKVQIRKTKKGRKYYICENNPASCKYISWNQPKPGETWSEEQVASTKAKSKRKPAKKKKTNKK